MRSPLPFLQAKQAYFPQLFLIREVLQFSNHPYSLPLDLFHIWLVVRSLEFQMCFTRAELEGQDYLLQPAGNDLTNYTPSFLAMRVLLLDSLATSTPRYFSAELLFSRLAPTF